MTPNSAPPVGGLPFRFGSASHLLRSLRDRGISHRKRPGRLCLVRRRPNPRRRRSQKAHPRPAESPHASRTVFPGLSRALRFRGFRVPFLYSTNGEIIWHHDIRHPLNRSRQIAAFHTPEALREILARDLRSYETLRSQPNDHPRIRPYQREANTAIEEAIAKRKRQMLVAMATGTGKTFTMVNEVYRLMKSGVAKRILFLVDRRALAAQAVLAFASFEPEPGLKFDKIYEVYSQRFHREDFDEDEKFDPKDLPNSYLTNPKPGHAFVYVSTIQRMTINSSAATRSSTSATRRSTKMPTSSTFRSTRSTRDRRRMPPRLTSSEVAVWRKTLDHFDADQDRPHSDAGRSYHWRISRRSSTATNTNARSAKDISSITTSSRSSPMCGCTGSSSRKANKSAS